MEELQIIIPIYLLITNILLFGVEIKYCASEAYSCARTTEWPFRLSVRTAAFHAVKTSSILVGATKPINQLKIMKYIQFIYCGAYGFFLGAISVIPILLILKLNPIPPSNTIIGILAFCFITVAQLFYVKTYKWLIYN